MARRWPTLLAATGHSVFREYYINDAGRQMDILAVSVWLRYLELAGETIPFPSNGYRGDYVRPIAQKLRDQAGDEAAPSGRRSARRALPPDAPEGDKEKHIDALIARARELIGADGFDAVLALSLRRDARGHPRGPAAVRRRVRPLVFGARARRERRDRAGARAPEAAGPALPAGRRHLVPRHRVRRREGPRGRARERPEDLFRLRHRLSPGKARARLRAS